jgi:TP901 family phage tail tape measure protein
MFKSLKYTISVNTASAKAAMKGFGRAVTGVRGVAKTATASFRRMGSVLAKGVAGAARKAGQALKTGLKAGLLAAGGAMAWMGKKSIDFDAGMSGVQAVLRTTKAEMEPLRAKAMQLGASTKFTASEAAAAMENLARAGFDQSNILASVGGVTALAASQNMDLATSASIVANTIRSMGLEMSQTDEVADKLAMTASISNTDVEGLGQALKFAGTAAKEAQVPLDDTLAVLAAMADAGIKGSMAGTSFTNMLNKIGKMGPDTLKKLQKEYGITLTDAKGNLAPMADMMKSIEGGLLKIGPAGEQTQKKLGMLSEMFGIRGKRTASAMLTAMESGRFEKSLKKIGGAAGTAALQSKIQLDNLKGDLTIMKSAAESFGIAFMTPFTSGSRSNIQAITGFLQDAANVLQGMTERTDEFGNKIDLTGTTAYKVITSIKSAIAAVKPIITGLVDGITTVGTALWKFITDYWDKVKVAIGIMFSAVKTMVTKFWTNGILPVWNMVKQLWARILVKVDEIAFQVEMHAGDIEDSFSSVGTIAGNVFFSIGEAVFDAMFIATDVIGAFIADAYGGFSKLEQGIGYSMYVIGTTIKNVFRDALLAVTDIFWKVNTAVAEVMDALGATEKGAALRRGTTNLQNAMFGTEETVQDFQPWVNRAFKTQIAEEEKLRVAAEKKRTNRAAEKYLRGKIRNLPALDLEGAISKGNNMIKSGIQATATALGQSTVKAEVEINDKRKQVLENKLCIDGKVISSSVAKRTLETQEREGMRVQAYQRQVVVERASMPVA